MGRVSEQERTGKSQKGLPEQERPRVSQKRERRETALHGGVEHALRLGTGRAGWAWRAGRSRPGRPDPGMAAQGKAETCLYGLKTENQANRPTR